MKIPIQPLPFYLNENDGKSFFEGQQATPVDGAAKLRAALSDYLPEQWKEFSAKKTPAGKNTENVEQRANRRLTHGKRDSQNSNPQGDQDRRQEQRRKQKLAILLDTRLTRCRRGSTGSSAISYKI